MMVWDNERVMWQGGEGWRPRKAPGRAPWEGTDCQQRAGFSGHLHMSLHDLGIDFFCAGKGYRDPLWQGAEVHANSKKQAGN